MAYAMMSPLMCMQTEPGQGGDEVDFVAVVDQVITLLGSPMSTRKAVTRRIPCALSAIVQHDVSPGKCAGRLPLPPTKIAGA